MKWWPQSLKTGDMIRVKLGSVYHYGIFVSEDEVIQFGPPPSAETLRNTATFAVMATDIDAFCCGVLVEAAVPETREEKRRFSPRETVKRARAAIGEEGYDLIHNNCEHFVYFCTYGIKHCTQAEEARRRFYNRPILNVYVLPRPEKFPAETVYPPERDREIRAAGEAASHKYAAWYGLAEGLSHALDTDIRSLTFQKSPAGKWTADRHHFSLSHTADAVAVAVSNAPVGVDLENEAAFAARHAAELPALVTRTLTETERARAPLGERDYLTLWTRKESIFKCRGKGRFEPLLLPAAAEDCRTVTFDLDGVPLVLSVCGDHVVHLNVYLLPFGERPCRLHTKNQE